jgi:inosine-uridine nucleoside N-ribohydrolase
MSQTVVKTPSPRPAQHPEVHSAAFSQPVFVDTDIGDDIDDALALALLLCSPEVTVVGVSTVFGDTSLRARLAAYLLQVYGHPEIPVAAGQSLPLLYRHPPSGVCQASILPDNLVVPLSPLTGPQLLLQAAQAYAGELTLLCFGPLTNIALALQQEPDLGSHFRQVLFMGGTSRMFWPDWNVRSDASAASRVLEARLPATMIGWNVTARCHLRSGDLRALSHAQSSCLSLLAHLIEAWQDNQPWWRSCLPALHDPLVVAALCAPQFFRFASLPIQVIRRGPLAGWTIPRWPVGLTVRAAVAVEYEQARAWMLQRWLGI